MKQGHELKRTGRNVQSSRKKLSVGHDLRIKVLTGYLLGG